MALNRTGGGTHPGSHRLRRQVRRLPRTTVTPATAPADPVPLVGRVPELGALERALADLDRRSGFVLLAGDPGTGKTRLLAELGIRARERGVAVSSARACDTGSPVRFQLFIEALGDRLQADPESLRAAGTNADLLAAVFAATPGDDRMEAPAGRFAVFSALRCWLGEVSRDGLVLLLDDAQWADPDSVEFLEYLSRHPVPGRLLVAVALRIRQAPPRLRSALARRNAQAPLTRIDLGPLDRDEAGQLIGVPSDGELLDRLYRRSQGNPLCLLSLRRPAGPAAPAATPLHEVILGELDTLSPLELTAASTAAVLGDTFSVDMLTAVSGLSPAALGAAIGSLTRRDLLRPVPGRPELRFRHPMVRGVVYESCEPSWRMLTHRAVLDALTRSGAPARDRALHVERHTTTWQPEHFAILAEAAAEELATAPLAAAHWYGLAARRLPADPANAAARFEARVHLARALGLAGRLVHSRNLLHQILRDDPGQPTAIRALAVACCARAEQRLGRFPEALGLLRREIAAQPATPSAEAVGLRLELGFAGLLATEYDSVRTEVDWAVRAARDLGDVSGEAAGLALSAFGEAWAGRIAVAATAADAAAGLVDGLADAALADDRDALVWLGWAELLLERFADCARHLDRAADVMRRGGRRHALPYVLIGQALLGVLTGRLAEARHSAELARAEAQALGSDHLTGLAVAVSAPIAVWSAPPGGETGALAAAAQAVALRADESDWFARSASAMLGHAALVSGDPHRCVELVTRAGGDGRALLGVCLVPMFTELLVEGLVGTGDLAAARVAAEEGVRAAAALGLAGQRGNAARALGLVLRAEGDDGAAAEQYELAAGCFAAAGRVADEARAVALAGPVLARLGRRDAAVRMLARSGELARSLGAGWAQARVEQAMAALGSPAAPEAEPVAPPPALTGREWQVAQLISAGHTNREIAGQLRVSVRTVEAHLAHIYRKLEVTSRSALAAAVAVAGSQAASDIIRAAAAALGDPGSPPG